MTIIELPDNLRSRLLSLLNTELLGRFINADPTHRGDLDARCSICLYDEFGIFRAALADMPDSAVLQHLYEVTSIKYFSRGIGDDDV